MTVNLCIHGQHNWTQKILLRKFFAMEKSNTSDETTPDYFFDVTDGKTTYTIMDQIYENIVKQKDKY